MTGQSRTPSLLFSQSCAFSSSDKKDAAPPGRCGGLTPGTLFFRKEEKQLNNLTKALMEEPVSYTHLQKALGAVQDAAKGTREHSNSDVIECVLGRGLPQAQSTALRCHFVAGKLGQAAL